MLRYIVVLVVLSLLLVGCFDWDASSPTTWSVSPVHYDDHLLAEAIDGHYHTLALWVGVSNIDDPAEPSLDAVVLSMNVTDKHGNKGSVIADGYKLEYALQTQEKFPVGTARYGYLYFLVPSGFSVNESLLTLRLVGRGYSDVVVDLENVQPLSSIRR